MKATGFVRRIDSLGRIVLPVELRERLRIDKKGSVTIHRGHLICEGCMTDIAHSAAVSL